MGIFAPALTFNSARKNSAGGLVVPTTRWEGSENPSRELVRSTPSACSLIPFVCIGISSLLVVSDAWRLCVHTCHSSWLSWTSAVFRLHTFYYIIFFFSLFFIY